MKMKLKRIITLLICMHLNLSVFSQTENVSKVRITPFTGVDYVRLEVDAVFRESNKSVFKIAITSDKDGTLLWSGNVNPENGGNAHKEKIIFRINDLKPDLWSPANPSLYTISVEQLINKKKVNALTERLGFRSFEKKGENLFLNGKPIFLKGVAINPPERGIPTKLEKSRAFALDYVAYMKSINVNIIRIPNEEAWFDVCDELGMMTFGGNYGSRVADAKNNFRNTTNKVGEETDHGFPNDFNEGVDWYENEKLGEIAHHPSLMVYALTNETPFEGERAEKWEEFLDYAYNRLKKWDETRVYIANAGYGYGKTGDICDLHRYWGWYYASPFTFLNIRDNSKIIPFPKKVQPITFTECVGNYTGPDGRYNLTPGHKNPGSQLTWTGHERQDLQSGLADSHQSFTLKTATELFRRLRVINPELSGIFPFTILFYNWNGIEKFSDMDPKPVTKQLKTSYQPILLSWECWTPNIYSGTEIDPIVHIVNDDTNFEDLKNAKLVYQILDERTKSISYSDTLQLQTIPYYGTSEVKVKINVPENIHSGMYNLVGKIIRDSVIVSENEYPIHIADKDFITDPILLKELLLYDTAGTTKIALNKLQIPYREISSFENLSTNSVVIIGENSADALLVKNEFSIKKHVSNGGRLLSLRQNQELMPNLNSILQDKIKNSIMNIDNATYPPPIRPSRNGYYVNPERLDHPVLKDINRRDLRVWSDYTSWDETKEGFPAIYPVTDGFSFEEKDAIKNNAVIANYGVGLEGIAIAEQFYGSGSVLLCGFDISNRVGFDPIADRLLINLVSYATHSEHELYPLIDAPIKWGEYETEKGLLTGVSSGFMVNSTPRVPENYYEPKYKVTKEGHQFAGGLRITFNTRPGIQYVPNGRRPFGPYFLRGFGGVPQPFHEDAEGVGSVWFRIPKGSNTSIHKIWNPSDEILKIKIVINDETVEKEILPKEMINVICPVNSNIIDMMFVGDRRLVVLETVFGKNN